MDDIEASPELADVEDDAPKNPGEEPVTRKPGSKGQGRKRTKTGCLTCRKRRIKCGEERPTCHNCTKSKRQCEGYNQRLVFKSPINDYRPSASSSGHPNQSRNRRGNQIQAVPAIPKPPTVAPKSGKSSKEAPSLTDTIPTPTLPAPSVVVDSRLYSFQTSVTQENFPKGQPTPQSFETKTDTVDLSHIPEPSQRQFREQPGLYFDPNESDASIKQEAGEGNLGSGAQNIRYSETKRVEGPGSPSSYAAQELFQDSNRQFPASAAFYHPYSATADWSQLAREPFQPEQRTRTIESSNAGSSRRQELHPHAGLRTSPATEVPPLATKESLDYLPEEDDPFDVSDDDMIMENENLAWQENSSDQYLKSNDLGIQVVLAMRHGQPFHDSHLRSVTSFINGPDMLATYVPSPQSSPLSDPMTARIFCHFVSVTGPCISIFERHPANPGLIFQGQPVPASQQHMWTYTFPTLALRNSALLHAMLALASLHIAKLQNGPVTASLKHYAIALRRTGKLINNPARQKDPVTLAAALLLAFYECWCADHQKWSNHVLGARQLVRLIDFAGMTKNIKQTKIRQRHEQRIRYYQANQQHATGHNLFEERMRYQAFIEDVDENLVGILMGKKVRYDQHGQILDDMAQDTSTIQYSERDLELYETQRDLFWWYCKQDTYQSILGGGRLFMDYELWANCPPRAPIGRLNATYGTYDHLMLLLGRLANFAAKDIKRKRLAARATGGWRPPMNMFNQSNQGGMRPDPQSQAGPSQPPPQFRANPNQPSPQMPGFSGMVPGVQEAQLPMGFSGQYSRNSGSCSPHSHRSEEADLATQLAEAEEEWQDIQNAFSILEDHFGEDFQPLGPEFCSPIQTPFGTALQYRTYGVAGIWLNYHMGLIVCHRAHPSMPPAAMMASGIAAKQTATYANEIGRIITGIAPGCDTIPHVNPGVGAALLESTTSLFVAGVQYQDAGQRLTTINHLHNVARLTGWQTALAIANGCETSWLKTAEMGKGPPYVRMSEETARAATGHIAGEGVDIWNTGRRIDRAFSGRTADQRRGMLMLEGSRVHYALGVLGVESDFEGLGLDDEQGEEEDEE